MYDFPEEVTFHPWVGSQYGSNDNHFGFRLLVLGESHYNNKADPLPVRSLSFTIAQSPPPIIGVGQWS